MKTFAVILMGITILAGTSSTAMSQEPFDLKSVTCNIATPDRDGMVYIDRVETKWPLRIQLPIGTTVPFHCTASGNLSPDNFSHAQAFSRGLRSADDTDDWFTFH